MKTIPFELCRQLLDELREAEGQLNEARRILEYMGARGMPSREAWLVFHKCHEAAKNLEDIAEAVRWTEL